MRKPKLWTFELLNRRNSGEVHWLNEPTITWPLWNPPRNKLTAPGPRAKPQPDTGGSHGKGLNPLNVGTGLPSELEKPRLQLDRPWSEKDRPSVDLVGGRRLLLVSEAIWEVLSTIAARDVEGIETELFDLEGKLCPPHWLCDVVTFRNLKEGQSGEIFATSPDPEHDDLGEAKIFRKYSAPKRELFVDDVAKALIKSSLNITRFHSVGDFVDA